jgi:hypothetical protein
MNPKEVGWEGVDWIPLAQDRDLWYTPVNMVMNHQVPQKAGNFLGSWVITTFWRRTQLQGIGHELNDISYKDLREAHSAIYKDGIAFSEPSLFCW